MKIRIPLFAIAMVSLLAMPGCVQQADDTNKPSIGLTGAWRSTVQFQSGTFASVKDLEFMYVFNSGGTMTESSNYDGAPPVPPAYGIWREVGQNQFEARYEFYITRLPDSTDGMVLGAGFLPAGRGIIAEKITLSADGNAFSSQLRMELLDKSGAKVESSEATSAGQRVTF